MAWQQRPHVQGQIITAAIWNQQIKANGSLYINVYTPTYPALWPSLSIVIDRLNVHGHVFRSWRDADAPWICGYQCAACQFVVRDEDILDASQKGPDGWRALLATFGNCDGNVLRQRVREILLEQAQRDFHFYVLATARSVLSWAMF